MTEVTVDGRTVAIGVLTEAADDFAVRAQLQEACRDRAQPGTGRHHQHAHSATLWRQAEQSLRDRISQLEAPPAP